MKTTQTLLLLGIILLALGLFGIFYKDTVRPAIYFPDGTTLLEPAKYAYPYQSFGLVLAITGIALIVLSVLKKGVIQ